MAQDIRTVGQLRKALEALPDDATLVAHVMAEDRQTWQMTLNAGPSKTLAEAGVIRLTHPDLTTIESWLTRRT